MVAVENGALCRCGGRARRGIGDAQTRPGENAIEVSRGHQSPSVLVDLSNSVAFQAQPFPDTSFQARRCRPSVRTLHTRVKDSRVSDAPSFQSLGARSPATLSVMTDSAKRPIAAAGALYYWGVQILSLAAFSEVPPKQQLGYWTPVPIIEGAPSWYRYVPEPNLDSQAFRPSLLLAAPASSALNFRTPSHG